MERNKVQSLRSQLLAARQKSMRVFSDIAHRLESVGTWNDVEWINDSKATDLDSTYYSLELMEIQWSAGIVMSAIDLNMSFAHAALPIGWLLIIVRIIQNWVDPLEKNSDESTLIPVKKG